MRKRKNILVVTYWSYKDALIQAATLPYLYIIKDQLPPGSWIYLVTLEQKHHRLSANEHAQVKQRLKLQGIQWRSYNYFPFGIIAFLNWLLIIADMIRLIVFHNLRFIHAFCTTAGSIGYFLSKLTGRPLVIDSYEPHAEAMVENETWKKDGMPFKLLFNLEKKMTHHAGFIISVTEGMRTYAFKKYNAVIKNFYVRPTCVDADFFSSHHKKNKDLVRQLKLENKIVCVYAGKFGGIYLAKEVFGFFKVAQRLWGDRFRVILLTNYPTGELKKWAEETEFDWKNVILKFVSHDDIPDYMGLGDFAITPVKPIPSKRYCTPIKDGEYWALGLPVVITKNISDDSGIIQQYHIGAVIDELNDDSYLRALKQIDELLHLNRKDELTAKIQRVAHQFRDYEIARKVYRKVYADSSDRTIEEVPD